MFSNDFHKSSIVTLLQKFLAIFPFIFFFSTTPTFALTITFSNPPSSIDQNQDFEVDVQLECSGCSDSHLRGVFYPSGTNYFGYTQNNDGQWINVPNSQAIQYYKVGESDLTEGTWSGKLKVKPDPADSTYSGPGSYFFKIGRLTAGGSATWADAVTVQVTGPSPTSTPTPTPIPPTHTPNPTSPPAPTSTPKPTSTSKPASTSTPRPTPSSSPRPTVKILTPTPFSESTLPVLGEATEFFITPTPIPTVSLSENGNSSKTSPNWPAFILIGLGVLGLGVSAFLFFKSHP